jgi:uncharacterized protein (DUF2147 family)
MKIQILLRLMMSMAAAVCGPSLVFGQADEILGWYWAPAKDGIVEIYKNGNTYEGKTIWILKPLTDHHNPDPAKRHHSLLGMVYLKGFVYRSGEYVNGTIYNPDNGNTYSAKLWKDGGDLMMRGFIGISLIGKTERLESADECRRSMEECIDYSRRTVGSNK